MTSVSEAQKRQRARGRAVAWIMVGFFAIAIVILNVDDIHRSGQLDKFLTGLVALIPVVAYVGLSEIVAIFRGWVLQTLALVSLGVGMMLTTTAVANVVEPVVGPWRCWFYGGVMDLPLAIGLYVIMNKPADCRDLMARSGPPALQLVFKAFTRGSRREAANRPAVAPPASRPVAPQPTAMQASPVAPEPAGAMAPGPSGSHAEMAPAASPAMPPGIAAPDFQADANDVGENDAEPGAAMLSFASTAAEHEAGRAAYRESVRNGKPLSDRALGTKFGRSRKWGAGRIKECQEADDGQVARAQ